MKYDELTDKAKETARKLVANTASELFDGCQVIDDWKQILKALGFYNPEIFWSGFWSQGDGACFIGSWEPQWVEPENIKYWLPEKDPERFGTFAQEQHALYKLLEAAEVNDTDEDQTSFLAGHAKLEHRGHYYHESSISYEFSYEGWSPILEDEFVDWCKDLMRMIYRDLKEQFEWETSDEAAEEAIAFNEYDFNEKGEQK
jgi:hypothetical protein